MATTRKIDAPENAFASLFKTPNFDVNAIVEAQRKNVEALIEANRVAFEGYKTVSEKQVAFVRTVFEDASGVATDVLNGKTPEANASKQAEFAQDVARKGFDGFREVSELALNVNRDAFGVIQKRFTETVDELKAVKAN
ncbi:hypothetical protein JCM17846_04870 [Iodidimonas nitroreducens]|uniref:Phasin domain-containing protein n=1 Tax=Iodidimonas nitroreducens TaxID=1236968 RepID=A0A5A7N570_9PROT|nr:phasin family protein [Iodidimonas nitroreducens]GAK34529.1 phasin family protein [alpha proteobacterium Q-1]GER02805.1 hypothetical protein JCM17846_04870 [Iodidimonas nitroreducens]